MAAERHNATVVVVRMAGQTADIRRDLTALRPMGDRVEAAGIEAAVLRIAGRAVEAAGIAVVVVAVRAAEVVVVRAAAVVVVRAAVVVVLRMRLRHTVAAESHTGKVEGFPPAELFRSQSTGLLFRKRFSSRHRVRARWPKAGHGSARDTNPARWYGRASAILK
jgi:hypothetical protein